MNVGPPISPDLAAPQRASGQRRSVICIVVGAFVLRLLHVWLMRDSPFFERPVMDAAYHVSWARSLLSGEDFHPGPFFRAPLYPWFLAGVQALFGPGLLAPRVVQAVLGAGTTLLTYLLGRRAFNHRTGVVASLLVCTSWVLIHFDGELLLPTLVVPLDLLALLLTLDLVDAPRPRRALRAGLAWGLATLARPNVLLFMPPLAIWLAWRARRRSCPALLSVGALALGVLLPILPVTTYNRVVGGDWVLVSSQAGINLWIGNNPHSDGSSAVVPGTRAGWWNGHYDAVAQAEQARGGSLKPSEVSGYFVERTLEWVGQEPGRFLSHLLWKARLLVSSAELGNNLDVEFFALHHDPWLRFSPSRFEVLAGLAALGLFFGLRRGARTFPLWGFLLTYAAGVVAFFVCARFRVPMLPVLAVFAGVAVDRMLELVRAGCRRQALIGLGAAVAVGALTHLEPPGLRSSASLGQLQLAQAAARDQQHAEAVRHFEGALAADPSNPMVLYGLALSVHALGDTDRALRLVRDGLQGLHARQREAAAVLLGGPELRGAWVGFLAETAPQEAVRLAQTFLAEHPGEPLVLFNRGRGQLGLGRYELARSDFLEVLALAPDLLEAYEGLALAFEADGDAQAAEEWRRKARTRASER